MHHVLEGMGLVLLLLSVVALLLMLVLHIGSGGAIASGNTTKLD